LNIIEFADMINAEIEIRYYPNSKFIAYFKNCEIKEDKESCVLISDHACYKGSPVKAINAYARKISGKLLIFNAMDNEYRKEYTAPFFTIYKAK
jgi:hypothetical protein